MWPRPDRNLNSVVIEKRDVKWVEPIVRVVDFRLGRDFDSSQGSHHRIWCGRFRPKRFAHQIASVESEVSIPLEYRRPSSIYHAVEIFYRIWDAQPR